MDVFGRSLAVASEDMSSVTAADSYAGFESTLFSFDLELLSYRRLRMGIPACGEAGCNERINTAVYVLFHLKNNPVSSLGSVLWGARFLGSRCAGLFSSLEDPLQSLNSRAYFVDPAGIFATGSLHQTVEWLAFP
jgi:hypothetical protein